MTELHSPKEFNLIMISAEMEHGGNLLHRHFDGHPHCFTYGFESQLGTKFSNNILCPAIHPVRYGYSAFPEGTSYERALTLIWDEECKAYVRNPQRSKFRDCGVVMSEAKRRAAFIKNCSPLTRIPGDSEVYVRLRQSFSRANVVEAYFRSFFDAWENLNRSGQETHYVGYNPGMVADTPKLFADFPNAHVIHVVRNPFSAYADYLKRPYGQQTLEEYLLAYNVAHSLALNYAIKYAGNFHLIKMEDFLADKRGTLEPVLAKIGLPWDEALSYPSFNGRELKTLPPWGTVERPTLEYTREIAAALPREVKDAIAKESGFLIKTFGYEDYGVQQLVKHILEDKNSIYHEVIMAKDSQLTYPSTWKLVKTIDYHGQ